MAKQQDPTAAAAAEAEAEVTAAAAAAAAGRKDHLQGRKKHWSQATLPSLLSSYPKLRRYVKNSIKKYRKLEKKTILEKPIFKKLPGHGMPPWASIKKGLSQYLLIRLLP